MQVVGKRRRMLGVRAQLIGASDAAQLVPNGATVAVTGSGGGVLEPDSLLAGIEDRFLQTGGPRDLTFVHALGIGDRGRRGANRFAHEGMTTRVIAGHWTWSPMLMKMAQENRLAAYSWPSGVISQLLREIGSGRPGLVTRTGLHTFVDPRHRGGRSNTAASEELVELLRFDGREYLRYKPFRVDVALIRASEADAQGNLTCRHEAAQLDALTVAQAARACGGIVIAQVSEQVDTRIDPRMVQIPHPLVDAIVIDAAQRQTYAGEYDPTFCGDSQDNEYLPELDASVRTVIARRAAQEVATGSVVNVGFGMSSQTVDVLAQQRRLADVTLAIEQGLYDGAPVSGDLFGITRGASAVIPSTVQFDLFNGGMLDMGCLGMAQVDGSGSVNVSLIGGTVIGPGGFVDISQYSRKAVFCGTFTTKGLETRITNKGIRILREGKIPKFVAGVDEITYSGPFAREEAREAIYITERAVFRLTDEGVELTEIADGVSLEDDILAHMDFRPVIKAVRPMSREIFSTTSAAPST